jgi:hypothetical protein
VAIKSAWIAIEAPRVVVSEEAGSGAADSMAAEADSAAAEADSAAAADAEDKLTMTKEKRRRYASL